ncbi:MAG: hypothetical protein ACR2QE_16250 [Acidimicrobiales bacterium]
MSEHQDALIVRELNCIDGIEIAALHELDVNGLDRSAATEARDVLLRCIPWSPTWETDRVLVRMVGEVGGDAATSARLGELFINAERPWMLDAPQDTRPEFLAQERHNVAAEGLGQTLTVGTFDLIAPLIAYREFSVRARGRLCQALPKCRERVRAVALMVRLLEDELAMRLYAIWTLRLLRATETRRMVAVFADDADEWVRKEVHVTLARFDQIDARS